ncbi:hypothetical protein E2C01_070438 [Portunus trituberculatus]|uniref:Uncharacterized protein n=1 Tax=Portunus trituberculatus TaxID=210409 RepID=A0A5B7I3H6_PORTR|nr:hypothetical protein [Portunus trituberculatus]
MKSVSKLVSMEEKAVQPHPSAAQSQPHLQASPRPQPPARRMSMKRIHQMKRICATQWEMCPSSGMMNTLTLVMTSMGNKSSNPNEATP